MVPKYTLNHGFWEPLNLGGWEYEKLPMLGTENE